MVEWMSTYAGSTYQAVTCLALIIAIVAVNSTPAHLKATKITELTAAENLHNKF